MKKARGTAIVAENVDLSKLTLIVRGKRKQCVFNVQAVLDKFIAGVQEEIAKDEAAEDAKEFADEDVDEETAVEVDQDESSEN